MARRSPVAALEQDRPSVLQVVGERGPRRPPEQPDPLLAALAEDPDLAAPEVERPELGGGQLADPQPGGVGGLDERPVAQRQRVPDARPAPGRRPGGAARSASTTAEQPRDLLDLEDARQAARQAGRGDRTPRIARGQLVPGRPAMEGPDGREPLGDRRPRVALAEHGEVGAQVGPAGRRQSQPRAASQAR